MNEPLHQAATTPLRFICAFLLIVLLAIAITAYNYADYQIAITACVVAAYCICLFTEIFKRDLTKSITNDLQNPSKNSYDPKIKR
ncbi:hypothetical protein KS4_06320 [Poriferisphaera corsica]|uniref:Uncharacterized protein n=1 Tax=Poriferisphaera corsica TaxID=2528020 RepID=A0A517YQU7_9BACT|nr:hypothetical protein [Poriferisphaera corsica]QDU32598.1 hypothetical protein KS4_06320 [Poriferisphaera corsica]